MICIAQLVSPMIQPIDLFFDKQNFNHLAITEYCHSNTVVQLSSFVDNDPMVVGSYPSTR